MSTIKSSDEHLTLNADGSSKDIKFQANGVEKASISSAGAFTSTTIDATKLTGTIPNFTSTGIDDNADATAMTIDSSERIGIGAATSPNTLVHVKASSGSVLRVEETGGSYIDIEAGGSTGHIKSKSGHDITFSPGGTNHLQLYSSGRAKSQFTARAWARWNGTGTLAVTDSHNVSSVTDSGTGQYVVNIDVNMANANYSAFVSSTWPNWDSDVHCGDQAVGTVNVYTVRSGGSNVYQDNPNVSCVVFGD